MWKNAPFLEARFNRGFSEAIKEAIDGAEKIGRHWGLWTKMLSSLARSGDITAIVYGGFPMVKYEMAKGKSLEEAFSVFEKATLKAQQSGLSSSLSQFQNSRNPFARLFLAFKNTSNQYFRKMVDANISYYNGDTSGGDYAKTMGIYGIIQPILYVLAGFAIKKGFKALGQAVRGEDIDNTDVREELVNDMMIQLAVSPVNAIPLVDQVAKYALQKATGKNPYKLFRLPLLSDLETGAQKAGKKEINGDDYFTIAASVLEPVTAAPLSSFKRYYDYITGRERGKKKSSTPSIG